MKLIRLEVINYRSLWNRMAEECFRFDGLDCLVGRNNAGKSNTLRAIGYLIDGEQSQSALHFRRNLAVPVEVRGFFQVADDDFERLALGEKRDALRRYVLADGTIGFCRRSDAGDLQVLGMLPADERLARAAFKHHHASAWEEKENGAEFAARMRERYPEIAEHLTAGKDGQKGEWEVAYGRFVEAQPQGVEFTLQPCPPPTGISADLRNLLPRVLYVPAVKEAADAAKTTKNAEFGSLLNELAAEVREELDSAINEALKTVYRRLNVTRDEITGEVQDERHRGVQIIERRISEYVAETFEDVSVSLEFPNPGSRAIFDGGEVWIEEGGFDRFQIGQVGEGLKRILIFSLFRTLADMRQGRISVKEEDAGEHPPKNQPLLILYEEAELFLHPALQKILLRALSRLSGAGDQVVFTTHSPFLVDADVLSTITLLRKDPAAGTAATEVHRVLQSYTASEQNRLLQIQHLAGYVFADRVVLVEGDSDRIVLEKLAKRLASSWDALQRAVPLLSVGGKGDLALFRRFLKQLGIQPFVVTDIDAVEDAVPKLTEDAATLEKCSLLRGRATALSQDGTVDKSDVRRLVDQWSWNDVFDALAVLHERLRESEPDSDQEAALARLLKYREERGKRTLLRDRSSALAAEVQELAEQLLSEHILLLHGMLEDYYPAEGNKRDAALAFDAATVDLAALRRRFRVRDGEHATDIDAFFAMIFDGSAEGSLPPEDQ
jgi:putative ATP-dependent endonuclease of the OLD family